MIDSMEGRLFKDKFIESVMNMSAEPGNDSTVNHIVNLEHTMHQSYQKATQPKEILKDLKKEDE